MLGFRTVLAFFMYVRDVRQARILTMIGCRWPGFGSGSGASGPKQWPISWANVFTPVPFIFTVQGFMLPRRRTAHALLVSTSRSWLGNSHRFTYPAEEHARDMQTQSKEGTSATDAGKPFDPTLALILLQRCTFV
eukprot:scaffold47_cov334-Pavlova_lutheri.AAC.67